MAQPVQQIRNDYSSTNVTTSAYVQLDAALNETSNEIEVFDSSGQTLVLAVGPASGESDFMYVFPGGLSRQKVTLPEGARLSIKAVSGNATSGEISINLFGGR